MSELIKSVRVRRRSQNEGSLDLRVNLVKRKNDIILSGVSGSRLVWKSVTYKGKRYKDFTNDDFIDDFIKINSKLENIEYDIIQDPWLDTPPKWRNFGSDPYYLNNGGEVYISWSWLDGILEINGEDISKIEPGGKKWSDDFGNELKVPKSEDSDNKWKYYIIKKIKIKGWNGEEFEIDKSGVLSRYQSSGKEYTGTIEDIDIINELISLWKVKVPKYESIIEALSGQQDSLRLCRNNASSCRVGPDNNPLQGIRYISPIDELDNLEESETREKTSEKDKLNVIIPKDLNPKVKEDISFKIFLGDPPKTELPVSSGFDFGDEEDLSDLLLDDEFRESQFEGLSEEEIKLQDDISSNQESFNTGLSNPLPMKVNISLSSNLDGLLRDAGTIARILGKNPRVNYENLKIGYKKGIHGLCPQGTMAVLVAMTGIKELGLIGGNADWFSFKNPATDGVPYATGLGFDKSINSKSYYNSKVRINQINGSWKGTYLQSSNMWQVGDILVCGYTGGKKYGHIQIWTGYSWMSDFKQNAIQQKNVDPNTVALWRLNQTGIDLINNKKALS